MLLNSKVYRKNIFHGKFFNSFVSNELNLNTISHKCDRRQSKTDKVVHLSPLSFGRLS